MAQKKKSEDQGQETSLGQQGLLLEVGPEGMEKIRPFVTKCRKQQAIRSKAWNAIVDAKDNIRLLVHAEGVRPAPNGKIIFNCDGTEVVVTPRDDLVELKDAKKEE